MFLPPFPFPDQWERVKKIQQQHQEIFWSVPIDQTTEQQQFPEQHLDDSSWYDAGGYEVTTEGGEGEEGEEILELNEEWANKLAATIERMNRKRKPNILNESDATPATSSQPAPKKTKRNRGKQKKKKKKNPN